MTHSYCYRFGKECATIAAVFAMVSGTARGDMSSLGVIGPHSGAGFSNLGAVTKEAVRTTMTNADVLIELQGREAVDLRATCTAVFDFDTDPSPSKAGQTVLVAFPVTGFGGEAVKITQFEVVIDGVEKPGLQERGIRLYSGDNVQAFYKDWTPVEANPATFGYFGFKAYGENARATDTLLQAYAWTQEFLPGTHCKVQVKYSMTLHAQSLAYAKKYLHGHSLNIVPFDAMWAGPTDRKAFFLDYILRSGATWKGPIGHETVTLRAAPSLGVITPFEHVVTFGRHAFALSEDDLRESVSRFRAGLDAEGVTSPRFGDASIGGKQPDRIVWEIDHEKPTQDILVEIPALEVRERAPAMKGPR